MTTFKRHIEISASKSSIWSILSDFDAVQKYHPGISRSYYNTDQTMGKGAERVCVLIPSGKILESVKQWEEGSGYILQVEPLEKAPPVKDFLADFQLHDLSTNTTKVSITIKYDMKLGAIGTLLNKLVIQSKIEKDIEFLLQGLKIHSETGIEILDREDLKMKLQTKI